MDKKFIAGVDIGGTWIRVAICTTDLKIENIKRKITKTPKKQNFRDTKINKFSISSSISQLLSNLLSENNITYDQLLGIGIATTGQLNLEKGEVINNFYFGFRKIPLKEPIEKSFPGIPFYLINDCNAAVLGIHYFEAENNEKDNLFYITMSTGIGGGVICNGHLLLGKNGNAAEVGHSLVEPKGNGTRGSWTTYSSGTGVKIRALNKLNEGKLNAEKLLKIVNFDETMITAKEIFQAARMGDQLSRKIVDDCVFYTKVGVGLINNCYDCSSIYFGGAMMKDKDQIIPPICEQFEKNPIDFTINTPPKIKVSKYYDEIGLMGALAFAKYNLEKNQVVI
ncbi:MAG: ROK family protein [Candidatus Lokiarchaeota archaeon]|nr:ROK family protein [Candidatus Lokiarchaeota archaeon]